MTNEENIEGIEKVIEPQKEDSNLTLIMFQSIMNNGIVKNLANENGVVI